MHETTQFDFLTLSGRDRYKLLIGAVVPRPVAWVTTLSAEGVVNAAPFSFFNCLSSDPAILALGVEYRPDGRQKDTGRNIRDTQAFTVNIVSGALLEAMNISASPFEPEIDELALAGLITRPGVRVPCPASAAVPAAFECRHHITLSIGNSREIILGEVVHAGLHSNAVDDRLHVDPTALDALGRMGGQGYATTRDRLDMPTITAAQWFAGQDPVGPA